MYKNFKLTDKERLQILEMHQSHGYKKPISEQEEMGDYNNGGEEIFLVAYEEDHGGPKMLVYDTIKTFRSMEDAEKYYDELNSLRDGNDGVVFTKVKLF